MRRIRTKTLIGILIAAAVMLVSASALADSRNCATANVEETFVLPDGSEHGPGHLTLCRGDDFTPSIAVHVSYIEGRQVNMLFSDPGYAEGPHRTEAFMIFSRDRSGRLHLYGFSVPSDDGMETFHFRA